MLSGTGHNSGVADRYDVIADALSRQGWCVVRDFFPEELLTGLRQALLSYYDDNALTPAGIGRGGDNTENRDIRRDVTRWLGRYSDAESLFLDEMELLRLELNRRLMLGLFFYEAHFAYYGKGAFYKKHVDSFRGAKNRIISTVLYLNPEWRKEYGGVLNMFSDEVAVTPFLSLLPEMGTFVLFLSEDIPHEVTSAYQSRASVAGWFRCSERIKAPALQAPVL